MKRYAIYYAPPAGPFAELAAAWLGWDPLQGQGMANPDRTALVAEPRKYGFHGTLKPPFRLADGCSADDLARAVQGLAGRLVPVHMAGLRLADLHGFVAFTPEGDLSALSALAATVVRDLDPFRAPLTADEVARRRPESLTPRQRALLNDWGYPYVMEEFAFHLTLTGAVEPSEAKGVMAQAEAHFAGVVPRPFRLADLCLFGQAQDGMFHLLHRYPLSGA